MLLHQTLCQTPWLRTHCRSLSLDVGDSPDCRMSLAVAADFARWCAGARRLSVSGGFTRANRWIWEEVIGEVEGMKGLDEVELVGVGAESEGGGGGAGGVRGLRGLRVGGLCRFYRPGGGGGLRCCPSTTSRTRRGISRGC